MMNILFARLFAGFVTLTAVGMSVAASLDRGATMLDQILMVAVSVAFCMASHLLLAFSKRKLSWGLWVLFMAGSVYSHTTFLGHAALRAGKERALHSVRQLNIDRQRDTIREALAGISARPVSVVAGQLSISTERRARSALFAELSEAKRAAGLRDQLIKLASNASEAEVAGATDIVTTVLSSVTGSNQSNVILVTGVLFSLLLELLGAFLWFEIRQQRDVLPDGRGGCSDKLKPVFCSTSEVEAAVASGKIKLRVKDIREFLGCGQGHAMEVRRSLISSQLTS